MVATTLCTLCRTAVADPKANPPLHVVDSQPRRLEGDNDWGLAVCPTCGCGWYRDRESRYTFLGLPGSSGPALV